MNNYPPNFNERELDESYLNDEGEDVRDIAQRAEAERDARDEDFITTKPVEWKPITERIKANKTLQN